MKSTNTIMKNSSLPQVALSLIIVAHKRYQLLWNAYKSVLKAKEKYLGVVEIIIVNSSKQKLFSKPDSEVNEIFVPSAVTASKKRNIGWRAAKNDWIVFLDDDCEVVPDVFNDISEYLISADEDTAAYFCVTEFKGKQGYWFNILQGTDSLHYFSWAKEKEELKWGPTSLAVFSRKALDEVNGFDANFTIPAGGEDVAICIRLRQKGRKLRSIPKILVYHNIQTWNSFSQNMRRAFNYGAGESDLQVRFPEYSYLDIQSPLIRTVPYFSMLSVILMTRHALPKAILITTLYLFLVASSEFLGELLYSKKGVIQTIGLILYRHFYKVGTIWTSARYRRWRNLFLRFDWDLKNEPRLYKRDINTDFCIKWSAVVIAILISMYIIMS